MAIEWGAWHHTGGNGMCVGIDVSYAAQINASQFQINWEIYTANQYRYNDYQHLSGGGTIGAWGHDYNNTQDANTTTHRVTKTQIYDYPWDSYGSSPGDLSIQATVTGTYNGSSPSHTRWWGIPARPYNVPNPPYNVSAGRLHDGAARVYWAADAAADKPITSFTVRAEHWTGSAWSGWYDVAYPDGGARSVDVATSVNTPYRFWICTNNQVGSSGFALTNEVYNTPAAPTSVYGAMLGTSNQVSWQSPAYNTGNVVHYIDRNTNDAGWIRIVNDIPRNTLSFIDTSPGQGVNKYRVCTGVPSVGLYSAWVESNEVIGIDCYVWDGISELPATVAVWDGATEIPANITVT